MNRQEELKKSQKEFSEQIPQEILDIMQSSTKTLIPSGIAENCLKEGDKIPVFAMPKGMIKLAFSDADYTKRLNPNKVIEILKELRDA